MAKLRGHDTDRSDVVVTEYTVRIDDSRNVPSKPGRAERVMLHTCPACGLEFDLTDEPSSHLRVHDPEDFGL